MMWKWIDAFLGIRISFPIGNQKLLNAMAMAFALASGWSTAKIPIHCLPVKYH